MSSARRPSTPRSRPRPSDLSPLVHLLWLSAQVAVRQGEARNGLHGLISKLLKGALTFNSQKRVQTAEQMARATALGARILGINNRDLRTLAQAGEAALIRAAHAAGVMAPEVLVELESGDGIGSGYVMRAISGSPDPNLFLAEADPALAIADIARELVATKAQAVAAFILENEAQAAMVEQHAKALLVRVKTARRRSEWLREYLRANFNVKIMEIDDEAPGKTGSLQG